MVCLDIEIEDNGTAVVEFYDPESGEIVIERIDDFATDTEADDVTSFTEAEK